MKTDAQASKVQDKAYHTKTTKGVGGDPYLFIVGCPRSGTTLLHGIIDAHPLIANTSTSTQKTGETNSFAFLKFVRRGNEQHEAVEVRP